MASTYTSSNRLEKQGSGDNSGTWGTRLNTNVFDLMDEMKDGVFTKSLTTNYTLSTANGSTDEARHACLVFTDGGLASVPTITLPAVEKTYVVHNKGSTYAVTLSCGGVTASVPASTIGIAYCDGTDVFVGTDISTAAALLALLLTVDGAGSSLDADLLDGSQGSAYAKIASANGFTSSPNTFRGTDAVAAIALDNATYGGDSGYILAPNGGDVTFRGTSAADTAVTTQDFRWSKSNQKWQFAGTLLVGTADVSSDTQGVSIAPGGSVGSVTAQASSGASTASDLWLGYQNTTQTSAIEVNGDFLSATNSYGALSDRRMKQNIADLPSLWGSFKDIRFRRYKLKHEVDSMGGKAPLRAGVVADELANVPQFRVAVDLHEDSGREHDTVDYSSLYVAQGKVLQEALIRIESLEARVDALENA